MWTVKSSKLFSLIQYRLPYLHDGTVLKAVTSWIKHHLFLTWSFLYKCAWFIMDDYQKYWTMATVFKPIEIITFGRWLTIGRWFSQNFFILLRPFPSCLKILTDFSEILFLRHKMSHHDAPCLPFLSKKFFINRSEWARPKGSVHRAPKKRSVDDGNSFGGFYFKNICKRWNGSGGGLHILCPLQDG